MNRALALVPRKHPKQRRSKATVDAILEATARVLVAEGYDKASTNRIAKVAGVSVGSLYQYFPSKEALVLALIEQHCHKMLALLVESQTTLGDAPLEQAVRAYVRAMLRAHAVDPELHRVLATQALQIGLDAVEEVDRRARVIVQSYLDSRREEILPQNTELAAFILVSAVEAVTHRAVLDYSDQLASSQLEDEIAHLVLRYLLGAAS